MDAASWAYHVGTTEGWAHTWAVASAFHAGAAAYHNDMLVAGGGGDGWQAAAEDLARDGWLPAAAAEMMLGRAKEALEEQCPAECRRDVFVLMLANSGTIYDAVAAYVRLEPAPHCHKVLPLARDLIVSHAACAVGVQSRDGFMRILEQAFSRCRSLRWHEISVRSQMQNSWTRASRGVDGAWMSRQSVARRRRDVAAAAAALEPLDVAPPGAVQPPPGLALP